jgi:hypothetical protein
LTKSINLLDCNKLNIRLTGKKKEGTVMRREVYHVALVKKLQELADHLKDIVPKIKTMEDDHDKDKHCKDISFSLSGLCHLQQFAEGVDIPAKEVGKTIKLVTQIHEDIQKNIGQYFAGELCDLTFKKLLKSLKE